MHRETLANGHQTGRMKSPNYAVDHAAEMEAYYNAEQKHFSSSHVLVRSTARGWGRCPYQATERHQVHAVNNTAITKRVLKVERQMKSTPKSATYLWSIWVITLTSNGAARATEFLLQV
ncbi:hypothetical protein DPMN_116194 [Dreissena polymorpha]|uniref:Uncharacterized protein n=1 Tax=Dreissena polymorpha TaxID=45954 RepID=A0A9D4KML9_DREPO|nr:hypothetical protein DPMN_116194 [Dreissena polymorpha]